MKVAVLLGGTSDERDVSMASGVQVAHASGHDDPDHGFRVAGSGQPSHHFVSEPRQIPGNRQRDACGRSFEAPEVPIEKQRPPFVGPDYLVHRVTEEKAVLSQPSRHAGQGLQRQAIYIY